MKSNLKIFAITVLAVVAGVAVYNKYQSSKTSN